MEKETTTGYADRKEYDKDISLYPCIAELSCALEAAIPDAADAATAAAIFARYFGSLSLSILILSIELRSPSHSRRSLTFLGLVKSGISITDKRVEPWLAIERTYKL